MTQTIVMRWRAQGLLTGTLLALLATAGIGQEISYREWTERCLRAPSNRTLSGRFPARSVLPLPDLGELERLLDRVVSLYRQGTLGQADHWVGSAPKMNDFFDTTRSYFTRPPLPFQPFAQRVTAEPGAEFVFHGDFHGDIRSFIGMLKWLNENGRMEGFRLKSRRCYLV